jgi:hypothetical protein
MSKAALTYESAPAAYLEQFNREASGMVWQYKIVTSDATGLDIAGGPAIFGGIYLISAGTMASVYDSLTATGTVIVPSTTATVNYGGSGVLMSNGITCDWTSGTWLVLYVPAQAPV